jgi:hypothetical protein
VSEEHHWHLYVTPAEGPKKGYCGNSYAEVLQALGWEGDPFITRVEATRQHNPRMSALGGRKCSWLERLVPVEEEGE